MAEKKYSTEADMLHDGAIMREYSSRKFVTVSPQPSIDRVKVSIVDKGTSGQGHVDFYMKVEDCRLLCEDIRSGRAWTKITNDNGQYPGAYKYVAGENGSKHLNIGRGQKGVLFQILNVVNGQQKSEICPVPAKALVTMAFYFRLVMGLEPVTKGTYYWSLVKAFYEGDAERRNSIYEKAPA